MQSGWIEITVTGVRDVAPRIREVQLTASDGRRLPRAEAGAHVALRLPTAEGLLVRHYSVIGDDPAYRIAIRRSDHPGGSAFLHDQAGPGTRLVMSWPRTGFTLDRRDRHSLLVAGGIGITPILAMLRSLARRRRSFELVYAGRGALAYRAEVLALGGARARIHDSAADGRLDLAGLLAGQPNGTTAYVCGPAGMIAAAHAAAADLGWPQARVRSEAFAGAAADDHAFEVVLNRSGRRLRVAAGTTILDTLEAAGLAPLSDCRRGECGLCPLPVLSADGPIRHRDRYLSAAEKASGRILCPCVSRVSGDLLVLDA